MPPGASVPGSAPIKETHMSTTIALTRPITELARPAREKVDGFTIRPVTWWQVADEFGHLIGSANRRELVPLVIQVANAR